MNVRTEQDIFSENSDAGSGGRSGEAAVADGNGNGSGATFSNESGKAAFTFVTRYDQRALTAMARGMRKTLRRRKNLFTRIFGWSVFILGLALSLMPGENGFEITGRTLISWLALLALLLVLLLEDSVNGFLSGRKKLTGLEKITVTFLPEEYRSVADIGKTQWTYEGIAAIAEAPDYFIFMLNAFYAQVFDKRTLSGGTVQEFRDFIRQRTGKAITAIR